MWSKRKKGHGVWNVENDECKTFSEAKYLAKKYAEEEERDLLFYKVDDWGYIMSEWCYSFDSKKFEKWR